MSRQIRLGIDARILSQGMCGIVRYTLALLGFLSGDPMFKVYLFSDAPIRDEYREHLEGFTAVIYNDRKIKKYWKNYFLPFLLAKHKIELYHALWDKGLPLIAPCPTVMTIYDLYMFSRHNSRVKGLKKFRKVLAMFLDSHACSRILAISDYTKRQIQDKLYIRQGKISVAYPDCDREAMSKALSADICSGLIESFAGSGYFISVVGRLDDERKNVPFLLRSFSRFLEMDRETNSKYKLVIVGSYEKNSSAFEAIDKIISSCNLRGNVCITGYLEDTVLYRLIHKSKAMILVSAMEGFGIPVLEAFFLGVPVITSRVSALPEITLNNSALLVDPDSCEEVANAISSLSKDRNLRARLVAEGIKRLDAFKWSEAMVKITDLYLSAIGGRRT